MFAIGLGLIVHLLHIAGAHVAGAHVAGANADGMHAAARPAPCQTLDGDRGGNAWERAKDPALRPFCDRIASATSKLVGRGALVAEVLPLADDAERRMPGQAITEMLRGRALLRLGKPEAARAALEEARRRDVRAFDDPAVLVAWARANAQTGKREIAAAAYRSALPRASLLSPEERASVAFEGGMTLMALGPSSLDDAIAVLRQARRETDDALAVPSLTALALALDRAGMDGEARALLADRLQGANLARLRDGALSEALAACGLGAEVDALAAMALEGRDPSAAKEAWKRAEARAGEHPAWIAHARDKLTGKGRPPSARPR